MVKQPRDVITSLSSRREWQKQKWYTMEHSIRTKQVFARVACSKQIHFGQTVRLLNRDKLARQTASAISWQNGLNVGYRKWRATTGERKHLQGARNYTWNYANDITIEEPFAENVAENGYSRNFLRMIYD